MSVTGTPSRSAPGVTPPKSSLVGGGTMPLDDDGGGDGAALTCQAGGLSPWPLKPKNLDPALGFLLGSAIRQLEKNGHGDLVSVLINSINHVSIASVNPIVHHIFGSP